VNSSTGSNDSASISRRPISRLRTTVRARTSSAARFVVSGTLDAFNREEAEAAITTRGGSRPARCRPAPMRSSSVGPGRSKVTKAEALGIPILDEAAFVTLLETGELPIHDAAAIRVRSSVVGSDQVISGRPSNVGDGSKMRLCSQLRHRTPRSTTSCR